ncbi:MAG: hypothetical protein FVQ82_07525 [Planctomycetes bacterium]|nr:hypothetical protein [Planctomycetota bacterium]
MTFNKTNTLKYSAILLTCVWTLLAVCGCTEQRAATSARNIPATDLSTPAGMIKSLEKLPPVEKIEHWENEYAPGITITTKHYNIHTTMLEPLTLTRVPGYMESAYAAYQQQLPKPVEAKTKFTVYLFGDRQQWEKFTRKFTGHNAEMYLKIQKGAYYLNGVCVAYNIGRSRTFSVLGHEGWHQFNFRHFAYRLPSWLDEGIATLFETSEYKNGFFYFRPERNGSRLASLRKILEADKIIPLGKLLTLNPGEVVGHADTDAVLAFYAQAYALVRFLKEDDYGRNLLQFQSLLLDAKNGNWPLDEKMQKTALNRNLPMTAQWNRYLSPRLFAHYIGEHQALRDSYIAFCMKIARNVRLKRTMEIMRK